MCRSGAVLKSSGDGFADVGIAMPVDGWAPCADKVNEFNVVGCSQVGAVRALGKEGCTADGTKCTDRRVYAAGYELLSALEELFG